MAEIFQPVRGKQEKILTLPTKEGYVYFAYDTGNIYMDKDGERLPMGGSSSGIIYANGDKDTILQKENEEGIQTFFTISFDAFGDSKIVPKVDTLILNSDGRFFRVLSVDNKKRMAEVNLLAVSGSGGGGGISGKSRSIKISGDSIATPTLVNGQTMHANFTATSALDEDGVAIDKDLTISWSISVTASGIVYDSGTFKVNSGELASFEFGSHLRDSTSSTLSIYATGVNSGKSKVLTFDVTTVELKLSQSEKFSNVQVQKSTFSIYCEISGTIEKIIEYWIDGDLAHSAVLGKNISGEQSYTFRNLEHGTHTVKIDLFQSINGEKGVGVKNPLEFEIAVDAGALDPIIWVGDYAEEYYNYDTINIPFRVYDPRSNDVTVNFLKDITPIGEAQTYHSNSTKFDYWQITDTTVDNQNIFLIRVPKTYDVPEGEDRFVSREIKFLVSKDPNRDLSLVSPETLLVNFSAAGRTNAEALTSRQSWTQTSTVNGVTKTYNAKFENFNWYNNGWMRDENNDICLRISNGAKFSIPLGNMVFGNKSIAADASKTFEFQFKIRNVQNYSNLIKEYTRYANDTTYWTGFLAQINDENGYDNYDNYLRYILSLEDASTDYDTLSENYSGIERRVIGNTPFCDYRDKNGRGLALGTQDGFFASKGTTLNVKYVEDKLVNLSIVFDGMNDKLYIYLQGVLTAVDNIKDGGALEVNANDIVFNSQYCDIDLYKFRVYSSALSVRDILINYSVDRSSVLDYDHTTRLLSYNQDTKEYQLNFSAVQEWNADTSHYNHLLMPYVIFDTGSPAVKLPFSKADKKTVGFTFVNPALDRMYQNGTLEEAAEQMTAAQKAAAIKEGLTNAQYYYKHHCPSFISRERKVNLAVQGTSSEFYPRRNYKAKTKGTDDNGNDNIYMYMNKGPFAELYNSGDPADLEKCHLDFFYYNNYKVGTTKFTMKIDYMESSGTYNMGLANLVHNSYLTHPLDTYTNAFTKVGYEIALEATADSNMTYYTDAKGKTKATFTNEEPYAPNKFYKPVYTDYVFPLDETRDYRTNVQGFPVMGFWKYGETDNDYQFIGRYNMLLDKGSDEVYGFKADKAIAAKYGKTKKGVQQTLRKMAECWEFSDNARGFCSFKDPMNRHKLSFDVFDSEGRRVLNSKNSCPVVTDSYEYRYNTNEDFLDYAYDPVSNASLGTKLVDAGDYTATELADTNFISNETFKIYSNWEKANQWVWSTYLDAVPYQYKTDENGNYIYSKADNGSQVLIPVEEEELQKETRLIMDYVSAAGQPYDEEKTYYDKYEEILKMPATTILEDNSIVLADGVYIGVPKTVSYDNGVTIFKYDTKEYRKAKFRTELPKHFNLEYCLVYFIITEVMLAYDSRGKNCMMASWGPQEAGGDYIWFPIFYDMDTQLGVNNTGIPSFDYYENATIDGTFSTSDSVLWNNLFTCFESEIINKYKFLRNTITNSTRYNGVAPLQTVDHIEKWYLADPDETGEIEMRGDRPLAMFNMDEFFKYISITNPSIQYQYRDGTMKTDSNGTYFYMLQGDRSLSRQQFLARRLNFIDSWFGQGNYSRENGTTIEGRIGANNPDAYSDKWVTEKTDNPKFTQSPYYQTGSDGKILIDTNGHQVKTNYLDAEYWVDMEPYQRAYVTLGTDAGALPSLEYEGKPVRFNVSETTAQGIMKQPLIKETLMYLYGASYLKDIGDISRLYWSLFVCKNSPHLSRILLGNDHPDFYNRALGGLDFDAVENKPLLKEVNLTNIKVTNAAPTVHDFSSSEKLEIFKALKSNFTGFTFAEGVALHTLYLPNTITTLSLTEADNLVNVIDNLNMTASDFNVDPEQNKYYSTYYEATDTWEVPRGLYIEGLTNLDVSDGKITNETSCELSTLELNGGKLGYNSYTLVDKLYKIFKYGAGNGEKELKLSLTKVDWSPYKQLDEDYVRDPDVTYYIDNDHYGFKEYTYTTDSQWNLDKKNGLLYYYDAAEEENSKKLNDASYQMLLDFIDRNQFKNTVSTGLSVPILTGNIYINNTTAIDEDEIRNTLIARGFPKNLNIHFANVIKGYKAVFKQLEDDGTYTIVGTQVVSSVAVENGSISSFGNPFKLYTPEKPNYDFLGWSTSQIVDSNIMKTESDWNQKIIKGVTDYTYYVLFEKHKFQIAFYASAFDNKPIQVYNIPYGDTYPIPDVIPYRDDSDLKDQEVYDFVGYSATPKDELTGKISQRPPQLALRSLDLYAVYKKQPDIRKIVHPEYFEVSNGAIYPKSGVSLPPKVTLPTSINGETVTMIGNSAFAGQALTHVFLEEDNQLTTIGMSAFYQSDYDSRLVYFDFIKAKKLKTIDSIAFQMSHLHSYDFADGLEFIGQGAFVGSGPRKPTSESMIIYIPSSVKTIATEAFAYLEVPKKSTIFIGKPGELSAWDPTIIGSYQKNVRSNYQRFNQNTNNCPIYVKFYNNRYKSIKDIIYQEGTVAITLDDCFMYNDGTENYKNGSVFECL